MLFDSHAHLNFQDFNDDWEDIAKDCLAHDIWVTNVGSQFETSKKGIEIAEKFDTGMFAAVSLHPIHVEGSKFHPEKFIPEDYAKLIESSKKVVAVGETGIDFFHDDSNFEKQVEVFKQHIDLAKKYDLPLILHGRDSRDGSRSAYTAMLEVFSEYELPKKGVIHCFGGSVADAKGFTDIGFKVGFTGIVTFDKTGKLAEVVHSLSLDQMLIETDCPYLAPEPYRGKRNQPQYVEYVARKIAEIKGVEYDEVAKVTTENAKKLFNV